MKDKQKALALGYDRNTDNAPVVKAKGAGSTAGALRGGSPSSGLCLCHEKREVTDMTEKTLVFTYGDSRLQILQGDITEQDTHAIVNAANSSLLGGGGVDGAIHRAGGPEILEACKRIRARQGTCPPGEAVITPGGRLKARYIIHTVGPVWKGGGRGETDTLKRAYTNVLRLAAENHIRSLSFPAISTGVYRFPKTEAARIALATTRDFIEETPLEEIRFILFSPEDYGIYERNYREIFNLYG